jgi:cyclic beta-1,2-glucan synthetase
MNRWRVDATRDRYGQWCYLRDVTSGQIWSATHQPVCADTLLYRVTFDDERATFERRDGDIDTRTEIAVPTGLGAEIRRVTLTNNSKTELKVELTSYQEVVLAPILSDRGHRAFGNLFVQTEWLPERNSLLAMRRPRSAVVKPVWGGHSLATDADAGAVSCETDRSVFIGRGRTQRNPVAMDKAGDLPGTVGAVLDPVLSLRTTLTIPAGQSASVVFTTFHAVDRADAARLAEEFSRFETSSKYFDADSAAEPAPADAAVYQDLAALLLFGAKSDSDTPVGSEIKGDRRDLITLGITGELPILLARIGTSKSSARVAELVDLHRYWSLKKVECDLVIITDDTRGSSKLREEVTALVSPGGDAEATKKAGGIFVFDLIELNPRQSAALNASARIQINCDLDTFEEVANG